MKQFLTFAIAILGMALGVSAQNRSIKFLEGKTFAEVKEIAKKENKMIFIDFYIIPCAPCKKMDNEVYTNDSVADFYNSRFINMKIDAQKGEGKGLAKDHQVTNFPTLLFVSASGNMIHRSCGSHSPDEFIQLGADALKPEKQLSELLKQYDGKKKDPSFVEKFLMELDVACMPTKKMVSDYFFGLPDSALISPPNWRIFSTMATDFDFNSREVQFVLKSFKRFSDAYGDSLVSDVLLKSCLQSVYNISRAGGKDVGKKISDIQTSLKISDFPKKEGLIAETQVNYLFYTDRIKEFSEFAVSGIVEKYYWDRATSLSKFALAFLFQVKNPDMLRQAVKWIERSIELENVPYSSKTYAELLAKLGEKEKAIEKAKYALELAKTFMEPTEVYEDLLKQLKK